MHETFACIQCTSRDVDLHKESEQYRAACSDCNNQTSGWDSVSKAMASWMMLNTWDKSTRKQLQDDLRYGKSTPSSVSRWIESEDLAPKPKRNMVVDEALGND